MMRNAAEKYAKLGYKVFPLAPGLKRPHGGLVPHGVSQASNDVEKVQDWFTREPSANLGLACTGLIVIDCDLGNTWPGFERLKSEGHAAVQNTPSGGMHFLFRQQDGKEWSNSQSRIASKIDTRSDGGYIVVAPSRMIECADDKTVTGDYFFKTPLPALAELPYPPEWLTVELDQCFAPKKPELFEPRSLPTPGSMEAIERAKLYLDACDPAISGQGGHNQTFKTAQALVNGFCLEPDEALNLLKEHYNPRCEPPWSERELIHKVYSALKNPSDKPRGWLRDEGLEAQEGLAKVDISGIVKEAQQSASIVAVSDEQSSGKILVPKPKLWQPFPIDVLPGPVQRLCLEGAASMNSDTSVFALPALVCAASAIGNQFRVSLKESWNEPAILWGTIIGDSGDKKSPALQQVVQPIQDRQTAAFAEAAAAKLENPNAPDAERCLVSDVTVEALAARLEKAPYGLLVFVDELAGWFKGMGQYKSGGSNDVQSWLCFYDGRTMTIDRKTGQRTIHIPRASVCVCGGIQRKTMTTVMTSDNLDTGLIARLLMAMPPKHHDRWTEDSLSRETAVKWNEAITQLFLLRREQGATGNLTSPIVTLDTSAKAVWIEFYNRRAEAMEQEICDALRSAYRKLEGGAARLALVVHSLRWASGEFGPERLFQLDVDSMLAGIALSDWFLVEADRVYNAMLHDNKATEFDDLTNWIRGRGGSITAFELSRLKKSKFPTTTNAKKVLDRLVNEGRGTWSKSGSSKRGRPTEVFCIA